MRNCCLSILPAELRIRIKASCRPFLLSACAPCLPEVNRWDRALLVCFRILMQHWSRPEWMGRGSQVGEAAPRSSPLLTEASRWSARSCCCSPPPHPHPLIRSLALPYPWGRRACWLLSKCQNLLRSFSLFQISVILTPASLESSNYEASRECLRLPIFRGSEATRPPLCMSTHPTLVSWCWLC